MSGGDTRVAVPDEIQNEVQKALTWSRGLQVRTADERTAAMEFLKRAKGRYKEIMDRFEASVKTAKAAYDEARGLRDGFTKPLEEIEKAVKAAVIRFDQNEDRKRQEEQRRLQAEADEKARKEREALEAKAAKLKTPERREALLEQAAAVQAPVVQVAPVAMKTEGETTRKIWRFEIINPAAIPREYLKVDEVKIGAIVRATKGTLQIDGVRIYSEDSMAVKV